MQGKKQSSNRTRRKTFYSLDSLDRLEQLVHNLTRYTDYKPEKFWRANAYSLDGLPRLFYAKAESWASCGVIVNWQKVMVALLAMERGFLETTRGRSLTEDEAARVSNRIGEEHLLHVIEHLPTAFDSALTQLCLEALAARADPEGRTDLGTIFAEMLLKKDESDRKKRLRVRKGPKIGKERRTPGEVTRVIKAHRKTVDAAVLKLYSRDYGGSYHKSSVAKEIGISSKTLTAWLKDIGVKSGKRAFEQFVERILMKNRKR